MATNVLVLGDGTGGLVVANLLARTARRQELQVNVRLIGNSPMHTYQPGLLFLPFRKPIYWRLLLPGHRIPLVPSPMSTRGKRMDVLAATAHK